MYSSITLQKWHKYYHTCTSDTIIVSASIAPYLETNKKVELFITINDKTHLLCTLFPLQKESKLLNYFIKKDSKIVLEINGEGDVDLLIEKSN